MLMNYIEVLHYTAITPENLYDALPIQAGVHVRWSWHRRLPYPLGGFTIHKGEDPRNILVYLPPPNNPEEILQRLQQNPNFGGLQNRYFNASQDLFNLLSTLNQPSNPFARNHRLLPQMEGDATIKLTVQDAILMGCLDPYIAQMVGIYYVDTFSSPFQPGLYRVIGHWGTEQWPVMRLQFDTLPPLSLIKESLRIGDVQISPLNRSMWINDPQAVDLYGKHLIVSGEGTPAIRFQMDYPIEGFTLQFYEGFIPSGGSWQIKVDGELVRVTASRDLIGVARAGRPFQTIDIVDGPSDTWRFSSLIFQEKLGPIGDQGSKFFEPRPLPTNQTRVSVPSVNRLIAPTSTSYP